MASFVVRTRPLVSTKCLYASVTFLDVKARDDVLSRDRALPSVDEVRCNRHTCCQHQRRRY